MIHIYSFNYNSSYKYLSVYLANSHYEYYFCHSSINLKTFKIYKCLIEYDCIIRLYISNHTRLFLVEGVTIKVYLTFSITKHYNIEEKNCIKIMLISQHFPNLEGSLSMQE